MDTVECMDAAGWCRPFLPSLDLVPWMKSPRQGRRRHSQTKGLSNSVCWVSRGTSDTQTDLSSLQEALPPAGG